jgi:hypothetical protein
MNKYNEGKIYKITSDHTYRIYIGSTTRNLDYRITKHKYAYNKWKENNIRPYCSSYKLYNLGDIKYELLELYNCNNKKELLEREAYYIKQNYNLVVNKNKPTLSEEEKIENKKQMIEYNKEYYVKNKEQIDKQQKEYNEKNKEQKSKWRKEYYEKNKEYYKERYQKNKQQINEYKKEYYAKNKQRIYQQQREYCAKNKERINEKLRKYRAEKKAILI